ncbi:IclR family transcriptional regulator [Paenalcaligenes niemegkensis]|uniref:IclR family transcriptional regulator n=1 Tax=Paenalcaligenes niemegkensis TaxID=2895469 RepID=UPI001EE835FE|nr:IclR family transcriptional regulator [Paenalcaligenes niemegkensis]MCQ9615759.1 IclR family transcriptional regulator [Paenalcaligenes niemegkensis]
METQTQPDATATGPRTLRRGLQILQTLQAHDDNGLSVTEISRLTGLQRPTIYRLLAALTETEFVHAVGRTRRYAATKVRLPVIAEPSNRIVDIAKPLMRELAEQVGDAVFLVVREGNSSTTLWREIGSYPVQILATYVNKVQPLGVGSASMAILAKLDDQSIDDIIQANQEQLEHYGGMTQREMRQLIANTRTRGYSVVGNYAVRGALGVGSALCDAQGKPILGLSVTAITERMPSRRQKEIAQMLESTLATLAKQLF